MKTKFIFAVLFALLSNVSMASNYDEFITEEFNVQEDQKTDDHGDSMNHDEHHKTFKKVEKKKERFFKVVKEEIKKNDDEEYFGEDDENEIPETTCQKIGNDFKNLGNNFCSLGGHCFEGGKKLYKIGSENVVWVYEKCQTFAARKYKEWKNEDQRLTARPTDSSRKSNNTKKKK